MDDVSLKVFVGSIDFNATEKDVEDAFKPYGEIVHVILLRDKETQKSRGFGFVTFKERHSVEAAIKGMHKQPILGRPIVVNYAEKKSNSNSGGAGNQNNFNSGMQQQQQQQLSGYGGDAQQANQYFQGYSAAGQQGFAGWNQQGFAGWSPYWQQQQQAWSQWWNQQQQQFPQQQGSNQAAGGFQGQGFQNFNGTQQPNQNFNGTNNFANSNNTNGSGGGGGF